MKEDKRQTEITYILSFQFEQDVCIFAFNWILVLHSCNLCTSRHFISMSWQMYSVLTICSDLLAIVSVEKFIFIAILWRTRSFIRLVAANEHKRLAHIWVRVSTWFRLLIRCHRLGFGRGSVECDVKNRCKSWYKDEKNEWKINTVNSIKLHFPLAIQMAWKD